jgi:glycerate kinase
MVLNQSQQALKVLICIDKFKDTITATDAAGTIKSELKLLFKAEKMDLQVDEVAISDGGEGFLDCIHLAKPGLKRIPITVRENSLLFLP